MNSTFKAFRTLFIILVLMSIIIVSSNVCAQKVQMFSQKRDTLLSVAREYIGSVRYCALITVDSTGQPNVRTMDPFPPDKNMVVWFGTNRNSRKVREIRNNPKVTLYYSDDKGAGYVAIIGTATLVDDPKEKTNWWKEEWGEFYKGKKESYLLIKVAPEKLEILNYKHNILSDTLTWKTPSVWFKVHEPME